MRPLDASDTAFVHPAHPIPSAIVLRELRRVSASFPSHTTASQAELLRLELHHDVPYLVVHSSATAKPR